MEIDRETLREARLENLERLARSLGVRLPGNRRGSAYGRTLVRDVMRGLALDARRARFQRLTNP